MNAIYQIDYKLFAVINNLTGHWPWFDSLARLFLNDYFVPTVLAISLLALWFNGNHPHQRSANQQAVLTGSLSAALVNILLKVMNLLYYRPRPFEVYDVNLLFYQPTDSSLPSNAAALGFSIATSVWLYQRQWGWALLGLAAVFGLSRIFGGIHYPLDVITGAILGCISTWIIYQQNGFINRLLPLIMTLTHKLGVEDYPDYALHRDNL